MNEDFNKFVKEMTEKYTKLYNYERNKFIFTDIINIYIGEYKSYDDYVNIIKLVNECITIQNNIFYTNTTNIILEYHPLHVLLSKEDFNCIKELRCELNEKGK